MLLLLLLAIIVCKVEGDEVDDNEDETTFCTRLPVHTLPVETGVLRTLFR